MNLIEKITASQIRHDLPEFRVGDTVRVDINIVEGKRERIQSYEGIVIAIKGSGVSKTFTVRKLSAGIGVEKTFPYNMPTIKGVTVVRKGMVRRAKLNYLRDLKSQPKIKQAAFHSFLRICGSGIFKSPDQDETETSDGSDTSEEVVR